MPASGQAQPLAKPEGTLITRGVLSLVDAILSCSHANQLCQTSSVAITASKKRKQISLSDKIKILNAVVLGEKQADIAKMMRLSKQIVSSFVNNKGIAGKQVSEEINPKRFRLHEARYPDVESSFLMRLRDARARDIPVSGLLSRKRAMVLEHDGVTFSDGNAA